MTDRTAPHSAADQSSRHQSKYTYLDGGFVTSVVDGDTGPPAVVVQETKVPADQPIPVAPTVHGDYYVPPEGAPVLVGYLTENDPIVVGTGIPDVQTPNVEAGERILSHPLSTATVRFNADGSLVTVGDSGARVELAADGTVAIDGSSQVVVNGGSTGIVTDVEIDETNSNGGATGLKVVRDTSILI